MEDFLTRYWTQMAGFVAALVWVVRLESKINSTSKDIKRLDKERESDLAVAAEARASTNAKLDRLDDKIERAFAEFRSDIKTLIRQGASR